MSLLASCRNAKPAISKCLLQRNTLLIQTAQSRGYASEKRAPPTPVRQGYRGSKNKKKDSKKGPEEIVKREKYPGAFRPLPANQLSHPLFAPAASSEPLELPAFGADALQRWIAGEVMAYPMDGRDAIELFGLPKNLLLEFRLLPKPCSVIRDVTVQALDLLDAASEKRSLDTRVIFTGAPGCGKSHILLQTVEYCISKGWIVLYIPRAINLVNSSTAHTYDLRTQTYLQPVFAFQSLQRMLSCNLASLTALRTQREISLDRNVLLPADTPLRDLIAIGIKDHTLAPNVLSALLEELGQQEKHPVLLAVDDFQALYCRTAYRDAHFVPIRSYHLSMPRLVMEYASGKKSFARGAILGAISSSHVDFQLALELREALDLPYDRPSGRYAKRSSFMQEYTKGLQPLPVPDKLSVKEAASLFELWMKARSLHALPNDELFLSKYSEASGNPRHFVWNGLFSTMTT